jgi:tetraacyldisaccharide 4'-kinase
MQAHPYKAKIPVICVGNVVAGGSGKTPTALALGAIAIEQGRKVGFVTRGYGGTESGIVRVDVTRHSAAQVGDEALLLARIAPVWVGRDRVAAIREAEKHSNLIILDDGLQNPNVLPDLSLLVVDGVVGFGNGQVIPAGPLREKLSQALRRVSAVLIVGDASANLLAQLPPQLPVLNAYLQPNMPRGVNGQQKYFAFAGIGRPQKFYDVCQAAGLNIVGTQDFADHHAFTFSEIKAVNKTAMSVGATLLTTEKDFVRIPPQFRSQVKTLPVDLVFSHREVIETLLLNLLL